MKRLAGLVFVLSGLSGLAHAQERGHAPQQRSEQEQPATVVKSQGPHAGDAAAVRLAKDDCVGPPGFCSIYFGGS